MFKYKDFDSKNAHEDHIKHPYLKKHLWLFLAMVFFCLFLMSSILSMLLSGKAATLREDYVVLYDSANLRYLMCTSDDDGNAYHPNVSSILAVKESLDGNTWYDLPSNNILPNKSTFVESLTSCILEVPSQWVTDVSFRVIGTSYGIRDLAIPLPVNFYGSDSDYFVIFEGGDGFIYAAFSDRGLHIKNKDSRGVSAAYLLVPLPDHPIYIYQWSGSWTYYGSSSWGNSSITDNLTIATLYKGQLIWSNFSYGTSVLGEPLYTDNYALYNGIAPKLDIYASNFVDSEDIPDVSPTSAPDSDNDIWFIANLSQSSSSSFYAVVVIDAENFGVSKDVNLTTVVQHVLSDYGSTDRSWKYPALNVLSYDSTSSGAGLISLTFTADVVNSVSVYPLGQYIVSQDLDYIKANYTPISVSSYSNYGSAVSLNYESMSARCYYSTGGSNSYQPVGFYQFIIYRSNCKNPSVIVKNIPNYRFECYSTTYTYQSYAYFCSLANFDGVDFVPYHAMRLGLGLYQAPTPTPSPTPTQDPNITPTETPTPTPVPQTVIVQWPTSTPTPSPALIINFQDPTSGNPHISPNVTTNTFNGFVSKLRTGAVGLLAWALAFVPAEPITVLWYVLFLILILALAKLIIHFIAC